MYDAERGLRAPALLCFNIADVKDKRYHGSLRCKTAPAILHDIRNPLAKSPLLPHVVAGPKVNYLRLCKHIVKIDLLTLISSYSRNNRITGDRLNLCCRCRLARADDNEKPDFFRAAEVLSVDGGPLFLTT